jgi:hypothetical protein
MKNNLIKSLINSGRKTGSVDFFVKILEEEIEERIVLKIKKYDAISSLIVLKFHRSPDMEIDKIKKAFIRIYSDINFKEEFKQNLDVEVNCFSTWMYNGEGINNAIEYFLLLKFNLKPWKITRIIN